MFTECSLQRDPKLGEAQTGSRARLISKLTV